MARMKYAFTDFDESTATAYGRNLDISIKTSINVCKAIRGMDVQKALAYLDDVALVKRAIPYTRFTDGVGHRRGNMAAGRFPVKASIAIANTIRSAVANAANKGLAEDLNIIHICAHKAATPLHQGRQRRRSMKRTHIEVALKEVEVKKNAKKATTKPAPKPVEKKVEAKTAPAPVAPKEAAPVKETPIPVAKEQPKAEVKPEAEPETIVTEPKPDTPTAETQKPVDGGVEK